MRFIQIGKWYRRLCDWWNCGPAIRATERIFWDRNLRLQKEVERLVRELHTWRAQIMQLRVAQAEPPRVGWEVMAYIPQEVCYNLTTNTEWFVKRIAEELVTRALAGITHVNNQGKVNALVFAPLDTRRPPGASEWVQVLFDKEGKYKLSDPLPRLLSSEDQVRRASR